MLYLSAVDNNRINEKMLSVRDQRQLLDAYGQVVCTMREKAIALRKTWVISDPSGKEVAKVADGLLSIKPCE